MAKHNYYLKDKKIDIYKGVTTVIKGVSVTTYSVLYSGLWAYYKQDSGSTNITGSNLKVYDSTERVTFVINRRPDLRQEELGKLKIVFNSRVYDVERIDDYEAYREDYKLICKYSSPQNYNGIPA